MSASSTTFDSFLHEVRRSTSIVSNLEERLGEMASFGVIPELEKHPSSASPTKEKDYRLPSQYLSPVDVVYEASLRANHIPYQNLLILEKYLELYLVEEEKHRQRYQYSLRKKSSPHYELRRQIRSSEQTLNKKKQFATQYYNSIVVGLTQAADSRLAETNGIEQKLERYYQNLVTRLREEKNSLGTIITEKEQILEEVIKETSRIKAYVSRIKEERTIRLKANSFIVKENKQKRKELEQATTEYRYMEYYLQTLQQYEKQLEQANRNLKDLMSVEEYHTKTCMVLERAIILREQQKVQQYAYNRYTSRYYETNMIPQLKPMLKEKQKYNDMFAKRLEYRIKVEAQLIEKIERMQDKLGVVSMSPVRQRMTYSPGMMH